MKTKIFKSLSSILILLAIGMGVIVQSQKKSHRVVNVYDWFGVLSPDLLKQFEKETGISVCYDVYDSNEMLETKVLTGRSGYDIVFPSVHPYLSRQIRAGAYQRIDTKRLSNWKNIDPYVLQHYKKIDPEVVYALPYYWGALGFIYDVDVVKALIPDAPVDSWRMLFDPEIVSRLAQGGVSFLEEAIDVMPTVAYYLGFDPDFTDDVTLEKTNHHLKKLRPHIRRFSAGRFVSDLLMGEVCLAEVWSGEANRTVREATDIGKNLRYVIPEEGSPLWIDGIAIPQNAQHVEEAYTLINFLLKPKVSSEITNRTCLATVVLDALPFIDPSIRSDPQIYPPESLKRRLFFLGHPPHVQQNPSFLKKQSEFWRRLKICR